MPPPKTETTGRRRRRATLGYAIAASLALVAAAALRFDGLGESSLGIDEARVAMWAQGSLAELFEKTATEHSTPILHPLALWLVSKVEATTFTVRLLPALGSTLTVAVLLFLLPSAGVSRRTAFLSGTLAAVSTRAVIHAHEVREYSLDALVAALLIVGLLRYVRDGRPGLLLGSCLFLGPLVQYGVVLFGAAVLVTAALLPAPPTPPANERGFGARLRARAPLLYPAALFAIGAALSYGTTLHRQLLAQAARFEGGRPLLLKYLQEFYYGGHPVDLPALLRFLATGVGDLLLDQMAAPLVAASLVAGVWTLGLRRSRRKPRAESRKDGPDSISPNGVSPSRVSPTSASPLRVVLLLSAVSLAFAAFAAFAGIYPLGAGRHGTYLGPVIFVAAGSLLAAATTLTPPRPGGKREAALFLAVLGGIVAVGGAEYAARTDYPGIGTGKRIARVLAAEARPYDSVYVYGDAVPITDFHLPPRIRRQTMKGGDSCFRNLRCTDWLARMARDHPETPGRIWIVARTGSGPWLRESLRVRSPGLRLQTVVRADGVSWEQWHGDLDLYRLDGLSEFLAGRSPPAASGEPADPGIHRDAAGAPWIGGEPTFRSTFAVWRREDAIVYRRAPCSPEDTEARFFLTLHPAPGAGAAGIESVNRDFFFAERGLREDGKCLAIAPLPPGRWSRFSTGQWSGTTNWSVTGRLDEERYRTGMRAAAAGEWGPPLERAVFDLHLEGNELRYFKQPCGAADLRARFFLHLYPADPAALPEERRPHGFENRDFDFPEYGVAADGKCLAMVPLPPGGRFHRLATGQWRPGESPSWRADLRFPSRPAALDSITSGEWGPPAARSAFDLHLAPGGLWYHRADCSAADLDARFFLHLYPEDPADLPEERRPHGFENRDFAFSEYGAALADACLAYLPFPDYPVARLRTGQIEPGSDPRWTAELALPTPPAVE